MNKHGIVFKALWSSHDEDVAFEPFEVGNISLSNKSHKDSYSST